MAQGRISLPSKTTYSRSNSAGLAQSDHGAGTPVNNKGAFITARQQPSASSTVADEEGGSEVNIPSESNIDAEENIPSQPVPRTTRSDDGQSSALLTGGHYERPSGSAPLRIGADPIHSSSNGLHSHSHLSGAAREYNSLVVGYPILVPAELGETVWEHGVIEEDIFLPRAGHSGAISDSFCDESYWGFLCSATPESKPSRVDSRVQELSAIRARDLDFALVLEYERERCLDEFADGASYASVLEKQFGMDMSWSAPQTSIRRHATQPFIFSHQRGRSQSRKMPSNRMQAGTGEGSRQGESFGRPSARESIGDALSSTSPSRASPARQATVSGEEFRNVVCATAAPPAEVHSHASSCESHAACSHASSAAISRGSSPSRPSSRSPSRSSSGSDSSYAPSDAEDPTGTSRKRRSKQRTRPQAVKGSKADLHDNIPSSSIRDGKRKRATLASRQPPSTKTDVNPASTAVPKRPRVYAVDRHGDIKCPWPGCGHSAGVLQMRHHLSNNHRRPGDASSCYWPGCQASHFSSAPRHIDDYHLEIEWICPACNSTFKSERSGNRHIRRSCEAWQRVDVEEVKENWTSDHNGQRSTQSELKSLRNERAIDERPTKRRRI